MTKKNITDAIKAFLDPGLVPFSLSLTSLPSLCHPVFDKALKGGFEKWFYTNTGGILLSVTGSSILIGEKKVNCKPYPFPGINDAVTRTSKNVDIIEIDRTKLGKYPFHSKIKHYVNSGTEFGHNHIGQDKDWLPNHLRDNAYCLIQTGIEKKFLVGLLTHIDPVGTVKGDWKSPTYYDQYSIGMLPGIAGTTLAHVRSECKKLDNNFEHYIVGGFGTLIATKHVVNIHIFIVEISDDVSIIYDPSKNRLVTKGISPVVSKDFNFRDYKIIQPVETMVSLQ